MPRGDPHRSCRRLLRHLRGTLSSSDYSQLSPLKLRLGLARDLWRGKELRAHQVFH